ncbi:MAG: repeat-associated core domain protein, partial [Gemmataceae bacterium]|nr:repeat-associated core domain protein [Gemmataceae bacterium]
LTATGTGYHRLWPSTDVNWDVTVLVNSSGVVVERDAYDPFGATTVMNASWSTISGSGYSWVYLYQGGRLDGVTGSYAFRRRDEDPAMGRWTTPDPIGFGGMASNFYTFVADSPLVQDDPSGLKPTALTIEESKEPILGLAGAFAWPVKFVLNDKAAGLGGYVIQHVVRDRVTYQGNMPVKNDVHDFYEAFRVAPGETSPETTIIKKEDKGNLPVKLQDTLNDLAKFGVEIYGIASNDVYVELPGCPTITTIKGDAIYVDNVTPGAMTWKRGGDSWAGTLPSISTSGNQAEIDKVLNAYKATNQGSITPWVQHNITATGISGKKTTISGKTP